MTIHKRITWAGPGTEPPHCGSHLTGCNLNRRGTGVDLSFSRLLLIAAAGFLVLVLFVPSFRGGLSRAFTSLGTRSEKITVPRSANTSTGVVDTGDRQVLDLVTLLGYDAIPAILDPEFVTAEQAMGQMEPDEAVLGLSINGDARAYSIPMLSAHEIVNDVVGGVPVAVTW